MLSPYTICARALQHVGQGLARCAGALCVACTCGPQDLSLRSPPVRLHRKMGLQSLPVAFGVETAKWITVGTIDVTQFSVAAYLAFGLQEPVYAAVLTALILPQARTEPVRAAGYVLCIGVSVLGSVSICDLCPSRSKLHPHRELPAADSHPQARSVGCVPCSNNQHFLSGKA